MAAKKVIEEIDTLIRARYPIIYIVSWEEHRVHEALLRIARQQNKKVYFWSVTRGLVRYGEAYENQRARSQKTRDPLQALEQVTVDEEPSIFIFNDFHHFLGKGNIAIVRRMREVAQELKNTYNTLIIIAHTLNLASDLEKEITVVDFDLPNIKDLEALFNKIVADVRENPNIQINVQPEERERVLKAALGLTLNEAENVFAKAIVNDGTLSARDVSVIFSEKQQIVRKSGLLEYYEATEGLADIGGMASLKDWILKRRIAFSDKASEFGLPAPKGVLLLGIQGCGKSLCAKAISNIWELPLLRFDIGKVFGSLVGSSEENVRHAIKTGESVAPAVLWVDEIDKAFAGSRSSGQTDGGTTSRVFGTFLTWLSEKTSPVFIVATANDIASLPPELLRKGRLDEIFFVDLPTREERQEIFRIHLGKRGRDPDKFDLELLAKNSEGFSGAEIEQAIISALFDVFYEQKELDSEAILNSLAETVPLSETMKEEISNLRKWADGRARDASAAKRARPDIIKRKIEV